MKTCKNCNISKSEEDFTKTKYKGEIKTRPVCKSCTTQRVKEWTKNNKARRVEYVKNYSIKNQDKINNNSKKYYLNNIDSITKKNKKYRKENIDKVRKISNDYYYKNKTKILKKQKDSSKLYRLKNKEIINSKNREKYKTDIIFKLKNSLGSLIRSSTKRSGYNKKNKSSEILGCSMYFFKKYIESKFEPWMNWKNHGKYNGCLNYGWDFDHIIPTSIAKTEEEIIKLNHYTNFQPLCSQVNRYIKKNNI